MNLLAKRGSFARRWEALVTLKVGMVVTTMPLLLPVSGAKKKEKLDFT